MSYQKGEQLPEVSKPDIRTLQRWLLALLLMFAVPELKAVSVLLEWYPSPSDDVVGYYVYIGTNSGVYHLALDFGNTNQCRIDDLDHSTTYFFALSAFNVAGFESPLSNEVSFTTGPPKVPVDLSLTRAVNGDVVITAHGNPGEFYILETSYDLLHWFSIITIPARADGSLSFSERTQAVRHKFYRFRRIL